MDKGQLWAVAWLSIARAAFDIITYMLISYMSRLNFQIFKPQMESSQLFIVLQF